VAGCSRAGLWRYRSGPAVGPVGASQGCRGFERHPGAADLATSASTAAQGLAELSAPGHMEYHLAFHALTGRRSADIYLGDHLICEINREGVTWSITPRRTEGDKWYISAYETESYWMLTTLQRPHRAAESTKLRVLQPRRWKGPWDAWQATHRTTAAHPMITKGNVWRRTVR
jgi:hypothetical protein